MKALLVQPRSPRTYWSFDYSLPITGRAASLPPLGLVSLAALLPATWELRLVDLNVAPLAEADLRWADAVLVSGMLVHEASIREVLARARALGRRTVLGGPGATASPELFPEADHVFRGEAEGRLELLVAALESGAAAPRDLSGAADRPSMAQVPVPRFDLLDLGAYTSMSVQYSRGCPFRCEFCDIVELFGRVPRVKPPAAVLAELDALDRLGWRGTLFFVDDNFIGNRNETAKLLPLLARWQEEHGRPFDLYTEASLDLATRPDLLRAMVEAGFSAVFVGIETPSAEALQGAGKTQNLRVDLADAVRTLTTAGLEVYAGFIVGFDSDGPGAFEAQRAFISQLPIGLAMIGLLTALPGTALWRRLAREGRLRTRSDGDPFARPNFEPAMDERALIAGYRRLLAELYSADGYYARCERIIDMIGKSPRAGQARPDGPLLVLRALATIGRGPRRWHMLRLFARALRRPHTFGRAVGLAIWGEHLVRYTEEDVLPRLDRALAELDARPAQPAPAPAPARTGGISLPVLESIPAEAAARG